MAKRRRRKRRMKKQLKAELLGLFFIFLAIFGSGASAISDGFIPSGLENLFRFFLGIWYFIASLILMITGIILLVKRKYPNFYNKRMIGFMISLFGILLLTHIQTFERLLIDSGDTSILKATWQHFIAYIKGAGTVTQLGGGMLGGILFASSYYLFSAVGAKIVAVFSILIGLIFVTDISVGQMFKRVIDRLKKTIKQVNKQMTTYFKKKKRVVKEELSISEPEEQLEIEGVQKLPEEEFAVAYSAPPIDKEDIDEPREQEDDLQADLDIDLIGKNTLSNQDHDSYQLPPIDLLTKPVTNSQQQDKSQIQKTVRILEQTFKSFGVQARVTKVHVGPAVTKYEIHPEAGVKVSKIVSLHDDLALALAAQDLRIEAPIPGKSAVGIEVPNEEIAMVSLREVLDTKMKPNSKLLFALGRDISGNAIVGELNKMPHLLIAGATGSGKSVCINGIITSILMRAKPHEVKMMMIDPKKVELNVYNGVPHLLAPVVTDPKKASIALKKVVMEMERRYELFSETGTRNIESYNEYVKKQKGLGEEHVNLPYIVVLVDELADLMMVASSDVEDAITRLAQMARAAGIHLIIATQRPSVDVITGVIKANIPSRIAFSVSSQVDSRTILDIGGAEKLLGRGDMLYIPVGMSKPIRVQGAFLSDEEVERVASHCIDQQQVTYQEDMIPEETSDHLTEVDDELYEDAVQLVVDMQSASVSMLQRRFRIGYTRAARLIDAMEERGIVGPYEGNKPRTVLINQPNEEKVP